MNVKYFIIKGKKKHSSIYVRFWDSKRIDQKTTTGFSVVFSDWSKAKQRLKITATTNNVDFINNKLEKLELYIIDRYNRDYNSNTSINDKWLKEAVNSFFNRATIEETHKTYFLDWIKQYVKQLHKQLHNGSPLSKNTIKNYKSAENKIEAFEKHQKLRYRHEDINLDFHRDFIHYCKTVENLNNNSTGVLISRIKTFCKNIEFENLPINPIYKHKRFSAPKNETHDVYLSNIEIEKILKHDFSDNEKLNNVRDLFIIALRTGLRVSDISKLSKENFLEKSINITTTKTNQNLHIPIHENITKILAKRSGELPKTISDQKFNKYIKDVVKDVGIKKRVFGSKIDEKTKRKKEGIYEKWELITSHTGRRSMATNLYLDGVQIRLIMAATGHKSEKQFSQYVKATQEQHIEVINNNWKKEYE
ncbi:site-specific integrase [uncultured Lacinutrix sp.]|uniref:tyrosine-type recombinase/integrase n=1 Tax=uncultured Lacinutrix sp. TaxID=574032 RepID=UPI002625F948|nr:site-specific integrase [uncultured Lacinutrix sp.]